jgi:hypothetical protein
MRSSAGRFRARKEDGAHRQDGKTQGQRDRPSDARLYQQKGGPDEREELDREC